ncbi:hypothetical protein AGMMS49525_01030 [Bacteroidia bacterium]|nr:hypothetical protein AGMMS49525_01030 [Bacteroidia bacterium]
MLGQCTGATLLDSTVRFAVAGIERGMDLSTELREMEVKHKNVELCLTLYGVDSGYPVYFSERVHPTR